MKILQVCPKFHHSVASGSTKVAYCITKELAERGHSVTMYTSDMRDKYTKMDNGVEEINGVKVHRFRSIGTIVTREMKIFVTPTIIASLKNQARSFDIIHMHEYRSFQNVIVHHYARKYGVPYVLQAHGSLPRIIAKQRLKLIYDVLFGYKLLRDASKVIALNQAEVEQYRSKGVRDEKIEIIPNGIDLTEYAYLPPQGSFKNKYNIPLETKIILYLGRIHSSKGIDLLIKSFSLVLNRMKYGSIILVLIGPDDGYLDEVKSLAESMGVLDSVLFTGFVSAEDKRKAFVDADIFVTPSFAGFPMTFLEACATGTPIITTTLGDNLEWIDDNVGYVTSPAHHEMAKGMYKIISVDKLHRTFSKNCINTVKSMFSLDKVVVKLETLYEDIIHDKH